MKQQQKTFTFWIVFILALVLVARVFNEGGKRESGLSYSKFMTAIDEGQIAKITIKENEKLIIGNYKPEINNGAAFRVDGPIYPEIIDKMQSKKIEYHFIPEEKQSLMTSFLISWLPMILFIGILFLVYKQVQAGGGKAMSFGKSRARMFSPSDKKVTFKDVSGVDEAKEELKEVVDFLKDPKKYTALGGKIPKGVILVGPPGTGKTLLARAVAGEADVPFYSISGSDFVEMFVGVGASRVRDLFEQGKKNAPCIIFIDEIDAVGRHRGAGLGGGHDEREQTLNQLLVEMDGFESNEGVILIAATNRIDVLDPALLRPGRFDRRVVVGRPDVKGRHGILQVHGAKTPLDETVDLEVIARGTPGFTGADLANLVNEAALIAARTNKKNLSMHDFEEAKDKVLMGVARKSMVITDKEKRNTAYHEAGHTLVGLNLPQTDPIHKVTIIPRGQALGVTQTLPSEDQYSLTKEKANNYIAFLLGGRVAEELIFSDYTNGSSNDIERATELATKMVTSWGMSEKIGPIKVGDNNDQPFAGMPSKTGPLSEEMMRIKDQEVSRIINDNFALTRKILTEQKDALIRLAEALVIWETLDANQVRDVVDGKDIGVPKLVKKNNDPTDSNMGEDKKNSEKDQKAKISGRGPFAKPIASTS